MRTDNQFFKGISLTALLFTGFAVNGIAQDRTNFDEPERNAPTIVATTPADGEENVDLDGDIEITFSVEMDEATINENTLMLHAGSAITMHDEYDEYDEEMWDDHMEERRHSEGAMQDKDAVKGTIRYSDRVAVFTPDEELEEGTQYAFTVTNEVKSYEGIALEEEYTWSFTTMDDSDITYYDQQSAEEYDEETDRYRYDRGETQDRSRHMETSSETSFINLGTAAEFVVLAKENINHKSESRITGNTGEGSKADKDEKDDEDRQRAYDQDRDQDRDMRSDQRDDYSATSPDVNEAIEDMMSAFREVSEEKNDDVTTHEVGGFHSDDLTPGVHEWNDTLNIESDIAISGSEDDVWLIKIGNNLTVNENIQFTLNDGAQAANVYWYVDGDVTIGQDSQFEGVILSMGDITLEKGAEVNGRLFSQSSITLDDNTISEPRREYDPITRVNR